MKGMRRGRESTQETCNDKKDIEVPTKKYFWLFSHILCTCMPTQAESKCHPCIDLYRNKKSMCCRILDHEIRKELFKQSCSNGY